MVVFVEVQANLGVPGVLVGEEEITLARKNRCPICDREFYGSFRSCADCGKSGCGSCISAKGSHVTLCADCKAKRRAGDVSCIHHRKRKRIHLRHKRIFRLTRRGPNAETWERCPVVHGNCGQCTMFIYHRKSPHICGSCGSCF
jgi:hypothetical protein